MNIAAITARQWLIALSGLASGMATALSCINAAPFLDRLQACRLAP